MKKFQTTVLERKNYFEDDFSTEPYEAGWASEAIFFVNIVEVEGTDSKMGIEAQISPDGINWTAEGDQITQINSTGLHFLRLSHFGGWLRLNSKINGENSKFRVIIHLVLKE